MAGSINSTELMGHLGGDPKIHTFENGGKVCSFSLATTDYWKDKQSGERKEKTEWHRIAIFNTALIDVAEKYLKSGSKIIVKGRNETRRYKDANEVEKSVTEVVLRPYRSELHMLDRKPASGNGDGEHEPEGDATNGSNGSHSSGGFEDRELDDDIPPY